MNPKIIVCGSGNMALTLLDVCAKQQLMHRVFMTKWVSEPPEVDTKNTVAVHFGSGRELGDLLKYCERENIPIIEGSTRSVPPDTAKVVIIKAPNLSLPIVRFLGAFPDFAKAIKPGMEVSIVESHQQKKLDTSGTARAIAKVMGLEEKTIKSIRDPDVQLAYGVPKEHLSGHAYHSFMFVGQGVTMETTIKIHGRETYAEGAILLAKALLKNAEMEPEIGIHGLPLQPGVYSLTDRKGLRVLDLLKS